MAQKIQKTNVCRLLDAAGIAYELIEYEVDESDLNHGQLLIDHPEEIAQRIMNVLEYDRI
jgi:Cys-tRNA(Pro)/Cys-tRNA(Cys) deacylase